MITAFLFAAGQVIAAEGGTAVVRTVAAVEVGQRVTFQRLEHAPGPPGRAPFFRWSKAGTARVVAVRPDGTADVTVVSGRVLAGDWVAR